MFHEALDGAALAGRIAPFEQDHHLLAGFLDPGLQLEQFDLQAVFLALVIAAQHQVLVGIAAVAPVLDQFLVRIGRLLAHDHALLLEQPLEQGQRIVNRQSGDHIAHRAQFRLLGAVDRGMHDKSLDAGLGSRGRNVPLRHLTGPDSSSPLAERQPSARLQL